MMKALRQTSSPRPAATPTQAAVRHAGDDAPGTLCKVGKLKAGSGVALADMTVPQLTEACLGLERLEKEYENMSGICATLKGLVLITAKAKLGHGNYRPWLQQHFPKGVKTAERYVRLAKEFGKSDSTVAFDTLTRDLAESVAALREFQLDLKHPVVAKVAQWVNGRGAYQLMLDFPGDRGGDTSSSRKKLTPAQEHEAWLGACREDFAAGIVALDQLHSKEIWKAPSIPDAQLEEAAELLADMSRKLRSWLKLPKRERINLSAAIDPQALDQEEENRS